MLAFSRDELRSVDCWLRARGEPEAVTIESVGGQSPQKQMSDRRLSNQAKRKAVEHTMRYRAKHKKWYRRYMKMFMRAKRLAIKHGKALAGGV
jgi:phage-related protein